MFGLESDSTVSRIYTTWVLFLLIFFRQVMATPTEDQIHASYPKSVINIWKDARTACLYDCTEFRMQSPSERVVNAILYSTYKNCHTSKVGIGCTPIGYVPAEWISACFGGRVLSNLQHSRVCNIVCCGRPRTTRSPRCTASWIHFMMAVMFR